MSTFHGHPKHCTACVIAGTRCRLEPNDCETIIRENKRCIFGKCNNNVKGKCNLVGKEVKAGDVVKICDNLYSLKIFKNGTLGEL